jgi:hypothetical protein
MFRLDSSNMLFLWKTPYSPLNVETIENSQVISYLSGYNDASGVKATGRDFGISFYGGFFQMDGYNSSITQ